MKLTKINNEKSLLNSHLKFKSEKKKIYCISGDTLTKSISKEKSEEKSFFYNSKIKKKKKVNNFFLPYLNSSSRSRKFNIKLKNNSLNVNKTTTEFYSYDKNTNSYTKTKSIIYPQTLFSYKVDSILKPKLLDKSILNFVTSIQKNIKKNNIENKTENKEIINRNNFKNEKIKMKITSTTLNTIITESMDSIEDLDIQKDNWYKIVRKALIHDMNGYIPVGKQYKKFFEKFENKINFYYDIYYSPHFKSIFMFHNKIFDTKESRINLCSGNFLSKEIVISLHRRRIKLISHDQENKEEEEILEINQKKKIPKLDKLFELEDFFNRKNDVRNVVFANQKYKEFVFNQTINPFYLDEYL